MQAIACALKGDLQCSSRANFRSLLTMHQEHIKIQVRPRQKPAVHSARLPRQLLTSHRERMEAHLTRRGRGLTDGGAVATATAGGRDTVSCSVDSVYLMRRGCVLTDGGGEASVARCLPRLFSDMP
jgi:hypothetical protein